MQLPSKNISAKRAAQWAYRSRQIKTALKFRELWKSNPEGMERRRRAGTRKAAARHAEDRRMWAEYWAKVPDLASPADAKKAAELFLSNMRGSWRSTKLRPKSARSVLKRLAKMGIWTFDFASGVWIHPGRQERREQQRAERLYAEEQARRVAEAERARKELAARLAAEEAARPKPAPPPPPPPPKRAREGWHSFVPEEYKAEAADYFLFLGLISEGQNIGDVPEVYAERLEARGWEHMRRQLDERIRLRLLPYAEAALCA